MRRRAQQHNIDEEASVSNTFHPLVAEASTRSTKDRGGWKRGETLRFIPIKTCLACFIIVVVIGALVYSLVHGVWAPHDSVGASQQYLSTRKALRVATTSVSAVTTTLSPPTLALTLAKTLAPPSKVDKKPCSCWNTAAPPNCCRRTIYRAHKFGTILVDSLFDSLTRPTSKHRIAVEQIPKLVDANSTLPTRDYRHVVVTRNWLDAIISGYLYHKAGYECWMNARGEPKRIVRRDEWDTHLSFHQRGGISFPPRNNRSICSYLAEESEEDGIKVVMDLALSKWYIGVVPFWRLSQAQNLTLFVCYEDLVDPFQQKDRFHQILNWLFPAGEARNVTLPVEQRRSIVEQQRNHSVYSGGHATTHDPKVRTRLRALLGQYDGELFNHTVDSSNALFGCGTVDKKK